MNKILVFAAVGLGWGLAAVLAVLLLRIADRVNLAARAPVVQARPRSENVASSDYDISGLNGMVSVRPLAPDASIIVLAGKFDLHADGTLVLPAGVTVEQATDAFVACVPRKVSFQGRAINLCLASFDSGIGWTACLKLDGHVVYTGKPLPSQTVEFLDLAAKKLAAK